MDGDAGAAAFDTVSHTDTPAMGADHALTDRQTEPCALPSPITASSGVEHVENLCALGFWNARPFVAHRKEQLAIGRTGAQLQTPLSRRKTCSVFQYVNQRL